MTNSPASLRALALDIRHADTNTLLGVALLLPSHRYAAILASGEQVENRALPEDAWVEIDEWAAAGDAALPKRPARLDDAIASALLPQEDAPVIAQRFASIPLAAIPLEDAAALAQRALPGFLLSRRTAA
jgi:hypothetical protein